MFARRDIQAHALVIVHHAAVGAEGLQPTLFRFLTLHQDDGGGAVRQLAGVAGGDELALLDVADALEDGVQLLQVGQRLPVSGGLGGGILLLQADDLIRELCADAEGLIKRLRVVLGPLEQRGDAPHERRGGGLELVGDVPQRPAGRQRLREVVAALPFGEVALRAP